MNVVPVSDRVPPLSELLRAAELERCLAPFLTPGVDGVLLFDRAGALFAGALLPSSPMSGWEQLPPEAEACLRRGPKETFGLQSHVFDLRPAYAATERVGALVVSRQPTLGQPRDANLVDGLSAVLGQLLQAGFATWVTSELHLATSESTHRALTERNDELERAVSHMRELDVLKSNFLATVSHELRTPLTSVIGFAEMLLEGLAGPLNEEQRECVRTILHRGEELLNLISRVLEMSQLEVGAVRLDLAACELRDVVVRASETVMLAAKAANVTFVPRLEGAPRVLADAESLHRVLVNLLGNAIKFSRPGGDITITAVPAPIRRPFREVTLFGDEADDAVRVSVRDTGIGIPDDKLGRVFEAFYQVDASPTREHGGAGLGLSIVRSLVEAHGGEAWVESTLGEGTVVHFTLPLASEAAAEIDPG